MRNAGGDWERLIRILVGCKGLGKAGRELGRLGRIGKAGWDWGRRKGTGEDWVGLGKAENACIGTGEGCEGLGKVMDTCRGTMEG